MSLGRLELDGENAFLNSWSYGDAEGRICSKIGVKILRPRQLKGISNFLRYAASRTLRPHFFRHP